MRRSRAAKSVKNLRFSDFQKKVDNKAETFRELLGELEKLSCLAHDEEQSNHARCTALWSSVEGCP